MKRAIEDYHSAARKFINQYPYEVLKITAHVMECYQKLKSNEEQIRREWAFHIVSAEQWFHTAKSVADNIAKWDGVFEPTPYAFADNLFHGYRALFTVDCILKYAEKPDCDPAVKKSIQSLFN